MMSSKSGKKVDPKEMPLASEPEVSIFSIKEKLMKQNQLSTKSNIRFFFEKENQNKKQSTKEYLSKLL